MLHLIKFLAGLVLLEGVPSPAWPGVGHLGHLGPACRSLEELSLKNTCLCRTLSYKYNDLHVNLGFKCSPQTMVSTLNRNSGNSVLTAIPRCHRQYWIPLEQNKEELIIPPFTEDEFTRILAVAQWLSPSDVRDGFPNLSQPSPIQLIFCQGRHKFAF